MRAITKTSSSIILYWLPPSVNQQNGEIRRYNIEICDDDPFWYRTINTKNNSTTLVITGLKAYTNYIFQVQAVNDEEGVGPYSSPIMSRTFEAGIRDLIYYICHVFGRIKLQIGVGISEEANN